MIDWQTLPLGKTLTFQRGFDITKAEQQDGPYPVFSSSGAKSTHTEFKVRGPGVIIGRKGSLGTVFYSGGDFWPHDTTLWVKDFHSNDRPFAYYFLQTMGFERLDAGASNPTLNRNHIHTIPVRWPPLPTQRKIAAILSAYDDLIENNLQRIKILEEMAQNLYRDWFVKFRFPGHEQACFVDFPLGRIPEGWEVANLLDIAVVKYGKNLPTKNLAPDGDYPVYGAAKIIGRYTEYSREERTIITGCRGSVGEMQITLPKCFVTNNSFTFDVQQRIDFFWLFHSLKERGFADVIGGAAQPQITLDGLSKVQIVVPLKATRALFHEHAEYIFSLLWNLEGRNTTLRRTRDLLLPRLISGEVDVSALDISVPEEAEA